MDITEARGICDAFAKKHKLVFEDKGEVGFGRKAVGFLHGDNFIAHNPHNAVTYEDIPGTACPQCYPPKGVKDAYHKHDCLCVLVHGDGYEEAIIQLALWVQHLEQQGEVSCEMYQTGATGLQALFSGVTGRYIKVTPKE